jgi:perosamine synthetase
MVIAGDPELAARLKLVKGQGQSLTRRYWHVELGFNYRMTNICAAIGLAQIERLPEILARKQAIGRRYRALLAAVPVEFQSLPPEVVSSDWLVSLLLPAGIDRDAVMAWMRERGVDTRPVFFCAHRMPMYDKGESFPIAEEVASRGISLPSYPGLTDEDIGRVVEALTGALAACG